MKKCINISLIYAILGMCGGVFYREFTKFYNYTGNTALGKIHTHLFILGMMVYLIIALFMRYDDFSGVKTFKIFNIIYNIGVALTAVMMIVRGIFDVACNISKEADLIITNIPKGADASISGLAGVGHIFTGTGIILLLITLKKSAEHIQNS